uniref:Capsid protein n=1 Tax=Parvo-like hybrid virus UC2 TaxID=1395613 RepID=T2C6H1_9VIRU|nr:capsid protein [Parvo-like hybrid virus UC2]
MPRLRSGGYKKREEYVVRRLRADNYVPNKGMTIHGYEWFGPGNEITYNPARNQVDQDGKDHDLTNDYKKKGAFYTYNAADKILLRKLEKEHSIPAKIGKAWFGTKRYLAEHGFLPTTVGSGGVYVTPHKKRRFEAPNISGKKRKPDPREFAQLKRSSVSNTPATATMAMQVDTGTRRPIGNANAQGLSETPIDDVYDVHRGPPDYTFASLPYAAQLNYEGGAYSLDTVFRMTSPNDVRVDTGVTDFNSGAGVAQISTVPSDPDAANAQDIARWWDYYAGIYKYYHVLGCRWHLTFENLSNDLVYLHKMFYNDVLPNPGATNEDMLQWRDCESHLVGSHAVGVNTVGINAFENEPGSGNGAMNLESSAVNITTNWKTGDNVARVNGPSPIIQLSGEYKPGDFDRQVRLDANVENWTDVVALAKLPERLLLRVKNFNDGISSNNANSYQRNFKFRLRFSADFLVEFKELKDGLKYPVQRQPLTVTINNNTNLV